MAEKTIRNILNVRHEEDEDHDYFDDRGGVGTTTPTVAGRVHGHVMAGHGGVDADQPSDVYPMLSRLSLESEGDDADAEPSDDENDVSKSSGCGGGGGSTSNGRHRLRLDYSDKDGSFSGNGTLSMPGTPARGPETWAKEYASETDVRGRAGGRRRRGQQARRRRWLDRVWEQRKSQAAEEDEADAHGCRVLVRSNLGGSGRGMRMDMEEVRACRDLGFELPADWTVEIPGAFSDLTADTSSGGNSPIANWKISSPGDDPKDVKAKLKVWAQAVALVSASASRLGG